MFAFAIWDEGSQELLIARDRLGKKPVYYAEAAGRLCFASEITALYGLQWLPREVDPVALDLYLTHSYVPAPHSIFQTIRKLPPGHRLTARRGRVEIEPYWRLPVGPPWQVDREEILCELKRLLEEAIRRRMISDVPLGCFLSGGTDSSTVVAIMSRLSSHPVKTFSIGFTYEPMSELKYARTAARHFHTDHHEYVVEAEAVSVLPEIVRHFGEPFGDSSALPTWYVAELARRHVTVALNGDGGDELFAGYPWYENALRLDRVARFVPGWAVRRIAGSSAGDGRLQRLARRVGMSSAERFASLRRFLEPITRERLYSKELQRQLNGVADRYLLERYESVDAENLARMQYTDIMTYLPEDLLVKVDRMTMAHALEGRSPLLDHELVEFCARIPGEWKLGKRIFRDAVRDLFPPGFLDRPKMGFSIPVALWLRRELRTECERKIFQGALRDQGWLDLEAVRVLFDEHMARRRDWSAQMWNILMLALWTEQFAV
jgi:asparagine synthase (glutamine-hydrolysing)